MADLLFSLNAVVPLFLVMLVGFLLKQWGFIDDAFVDTGTKVCFKVALPCMLFLNIINSDLTEAFDLRLIGVCVGGILLAVVLLRLLVPGFIRDTRVSSAFIQVCFRSNYALLGLPFINNISGAAGLAVASTVLAFMIPTFNVLAVLVLAENQGGEQKADEHIMLKTIATNPLIIAAALGIVGSLAPIALPQLLEKPIFYIAEMAMPLALFTIGGSISLKNESRSNMRLACAASFIKLVVMPSAAVFAAIMLHFNPVQLSVVLALFAGPPAVSCFPMAFQMGADYHFTSLAVIMSTALAAITMFLFVFALRVTGLL